MKFAEKLTESELAEQLHEVLDRARQGEEFVIERDGEPFAVVRPPTPRTEVGNAVSEQRGTTWEEFTSRVQNLDTPGDGFADDLEAIQAAQGQVVIPTPAERAPETGKRERHGY